MFRYPLTATGLKWIWLAILITAAFVWLFNSYKLGKFKRMKDFSSPIRTGDNTQVKLILLILIAAIVFIFCALASPTIIQTIYRGFRFGDRMITILL